MMGSVPAFDSAAAGVFALLELVANPDKAKAALQEIADAKAAVEKGQAHLDAAKAMFAKQVEEHSAKVKDFHAQISEHTSRLTAETAKLHEGQAAAEARGRALARRQKELDEREQALVADQDALDDARKAHQQDVTRSHQQLDERVRDIESLFAKAEKDSSTAAKLKASWEAKLSKLNAAVSD